MDDLKEKIKEEDYEEKNKEIKDKNELKEKIEIKLDIPKKEEELKKKEMKFKEESKEKGKDELDLEQKKLRLNKKLEKAKKLRQNLESSNKYKKSELIQQKVEFFENKNS